MSRTLKWVGIAFAVMVIFVVAILAVAYFNRDVIFEKTKAALDQNFHGDVQIEKYDITIIHNFPNISIALEQINLRDSVTKQNLFSAGKIYLNLGFYELLNRKVAITSLSVENGQVFIYRTANGYRNEIFQQDDTADSVETEEINNFSLSLKRIDLKQVYFLYLDSLRNKTYQFRFQQTKHFIEQDSASIRMRMEGDMFINGLTFNPASGGFVMNQQAKVKINLNLDRETKNVQVKPSELMFGKLKVKVKGNFDLPKHGRYQLQIAAKSFEVAEGKKLVNRKLKSLFEGFEFENPINIALRLDGQTIPGYQPEVIVKFDGDNINFKYHDEKVDHLTFDGTFSKPSDTVRTKGYGKARIDIAQFKGEYQNIPFEGKANFQHLDDPFMSLEMSSHTNYKQLMSMVDTSRFVPTGGSFTTSLSYEGQLTEYLDTTRTRYKGKLRGKITAENGAMLYKPKNFEFDKVNAAFTFNEKQFSIENLNFQLNKSPVNIKGSVKNFIPFFIKPEDKGYVTLNVNSPRLDLTTLFADRNKAEVVQPMDEITRKKISDMIDLIYQKLEFTIGMSAKEVLYRKFKAENIKGEVRLQKDQIASRDIHMDVAKGTTKLGFKLSELEKDQSPLSVTANVTNANIRQFFLYFDNFNQNTLLADNLEGSISADVDFHALVDENYAVIAPSMQGSINTTIKNGGLINFEPLTDMSIFLFKNRDFTDIQFAEINSNFTIDGTALNFTRMEIQSSVLTMFLKGRYSFTDSTNMSVQLPLSNLKKRDKDYVPKNIGPEGDPGMSVYLHVYRYGDIDSKINIDYDPFKKWAKRIDMK